MRYAFRRWWRRHQITAVLLGILTATLFAADSCGWGARDYEAHQSAMNLEVNTR